MRHLLTKFAGKFRELQRTTVPYARVLGIVGDEEEEEEGTMVS
jgi:hypothetical protein